jgi:hypothetical protein
VDEFSSRRLLLWAIGAALFVALVLVAFPVVSG